MRAGRKSATRDELAAVVSSLLDRHVLNDDIIAALGVSRSTYYLQREEGRLIAADNLLRVADEFGINPVDLLFHYGFVSKEAVLDFVQRSHPDAAAPARPSQRKARVRRFTPRPDMPPI